MPTIKRHAIFWVTIYVLWTYMKSDGTNYSIYAVINLVNIALYMAAYYLLKKVQIPRFYDQEKKGLFIISMIISSLLFYAIWRVAGELFIDNLRFKNYDPPLFSFGMYLVQTAQFYSPGMVLLAWDTQIERRIEQEHIHQLEKEKMAAEIKFLKAQLNPHFLFNTLNNLYSYVINKSPKAPDMILRLSGMLDYVLYKSGNSTVLLEEEIKMIENFLELEKIRYGDRLTLSFDSDVNGKKPISPLILLSLVENAFKHGASGDIDSPEIKISIHEALGIISCCVWNTKSEQVGEINDAYKEGIGLKNIKRQLNLIYPKLHELEIEDMDNYFQVTLIIKPI